MSHFAVLVVSDDVEGIEKQLAPFQENNMGDCPKEFLEFNDYEAEYYDETQGREMLVLADGSFEDYYNEKYYNPDFPHRSREAEFGGYKEWRAAWDEAQEAGIPQYIYPEGAVVKNVPYNKLYATVEEFCEDWHGCSARDEETGKYGYWENPNAKWDWYQVGGRYAGRFPIKEGKAGERGSVSWAMEGDPYEGGFADSARKGDIDWARMKRTAAENSVKWWDEEAAKHPNGVIPDDGIARYLIDAKPGETREEYIERKTNNFFSAFAVLKDGKWYERGEMGWWACVSNEKDDDVWQDEFRKLIENLPDETLLTFVDCHI